MYLPFIFVRSPTQATCCFQDTGNTCDTQSRALKCPYPSNGYLLHKIVVCNTKICLPYARICPPDCLDNDAE